MSSTVRKKSISAYESLTAGLTIQTKDGDLVTLASSSYAQFDAYMYNSKGVLQTSSGTAMATENVRQVTLSSGEAFSFSVVGELDEAEMEDIEEIVKGIDQIISEMSQGDIRDAVGIALSMGGYDTVSSYAADITYERSISKTTEMKTQTSEPLPAPEPALLPSNENAIPSVKEPYPENGSPRKRKHNTIRDINQFVEKVAEKLEKHEDKLVERARKPVEKLFNHHRDNAISESKERDDDQLKQIEPFLNSIDRFQKKVDTLIEKMTRNVFDNQFKNLMG